MRFISAALIALALPAVAEAGQTVDYTVGGKAYEGYYAKAQGASKGLVLVIHDWDGTDSYEFKRADMLAAMGYDAFAIDLYGKGNRPATTEGKIAETKRLNGDRELMRNLIVGGLAESRKHSAGKAVVMGYCFGGGAALELARSGMATDVVGYVTFHGSLATPDGQSYPKGTSPILIAHGGADTAVPMEHLTALTKQLETAGVTYEAEVYSATPHAFTVFGSPSYREVADRKSWEAFGDFLKTTLGG